MMANSEHGLKDGLRHRSNTDSEIRTSDMSHNTGIGLVHDKLSDAKFSKDEKRRKSLLGYFMTELTKNYRLEGNASEFVERRDRVYTSVYTPKNLEKFLAFGFLQCLDSILYMVTFLPLRILVALMKIVTYPFACLFVGRSEILDASQVTDLLKGLILVISCYISSQVDMSMIYHIVRGQSIMKFYVFFNMLDVMDKLVSQFGQDILDSLYWTAVEPRGRKREHFGTIFHLVLATVYVIGHTMMILMQAIILNVAFNSHNKNLLTVMMSNNFVEIKVNVFKRVDKTNLCQITYSDVRERFHYVVLLFFVFVRNMKELQWNWDMALPLLQDAAIVFLVEVIVDWIKHAFITKLSELSASHYGEFSLGLAQDIASSQKKHAFTNFSDQVCRRMGFTPIPLICLLYMVCSSTFSVDGPRACFIVFLLYICLISAKVLNSIVLLGWAQRLLDERDKKTQSSRGTVINSQTHPKKEDKKDLGNLKPTSTAQVTESDNITRTSLIADSSNNQLNISQSQSITSTNQFTQQDGFNCFCQQSPAIDISALVTEKSTFSDVNHTGKRPGLNSPMIGTTDAFLYTRDIADAHKSSTNSTDCLQTFPQLSVDTSYTMKSFNISDGGQTSSPSIREQTPETADAHLETRSFTPVSAGKIFNGNSSNSTTITTIPVLAHAPIHNVSPPIMVIPTASVLNTSTNISRSQSTPVQVESSSSSVTSYSPTVVACTTSAEHKSHAITVRSPKRKHSATSITSADSFMLEPCELTTEPPVESDVCFTAEENHRQDSWLIGETVIPKVTQPSVDPLISISDDKKDAEHDLDIAKSSPSSSGAKRDNL